MWGETARHKTYCDAQPFWEAIPFKIPDLEVKQAGRHYISIFKISVKANKEEFYDFICYGHGFFHFNFNYVKNYNFCGAKEPPCLSFP